MKTAYNSKPTNIATAGPEKPLPIMKALTADPAVETFAGAETVWDAMEDASALPDPGISVMLAVDAVCEAKADELAPTESVWTSLSVVAVTITVNLLIEVPS